jgi:hypothetical protein
MASNGMENFNVGFVAEKGMGRSQEMPSLLAQIRIDPPLI